MKIVALSVIPMMAVMSIASAPAYGQNLLGIIGASGEDALVTIGSGNASSSGLVNLGLGGGGNQVLDAQIGGQNDLVNANVTAGGSSALGANASVLGGAATIGASVGGATWSILMLVWAAAALAAEEAVAAMAVAMVPALVVVGPVAVNCRWRQLPRAVAAQRHVPGPAPTTSSA